MSKCEACGGDGQIEYGAYRGEETTETRECRLCGGVVTTATGLAAIGPTAAEASSALTRLGQASITLMSSISGVRVPEATLITEQRQRALQTAKEVAVERLEQLRQKNEREQAKAELLEARRLKIESELTLLEIQRGAYIAKDTEAIADKYEQDLRRELRANSNNDKMNELIRRGML